MTSASAGGTENPGWQVGPQWTVIGNMSSELRGGSDPTRNYSGTRLFAPGAKLYLGEIYRGTGESARVIGRAKDNKKLVNCVIRLELLQNLRPKLVYSEPTIRRLLKLEAKFYDSREQASAAADEVRALTGFQRASRLGRFGELE